MRNVTPHDAFMFSYIKRFQNITYIDPSITIDDLWSEAYLIHAKLQKEELTCEFMTALGKQIEQRFMDMYKIAKRANDKLDRSQFIEDFAIEKSKLSRILFSELPSRLQTLVKEILQNPKKFGEYVPGPGLHKKHLVAYLTKELQWKRKAAIDFALTINQNHQKTSHREALTA